MSGRRVSSRKHETNTTAGELVRKGQAEVPRQSLDKKTQIITHSIVGGNICVLPPITGAQAPIPILHRCKVGECSEYIDQHFGY